VHQRITKPIKSDDRGYRKRKHARSKKDKNSYIGYYRVRIKTDAFEDKTRNTTKSVVSRKERLQNIYQTLVKYIGHSVIVRLP
jgi:hypothetical protein